MSSDDADNVSGYSEDEEKQNEEEEVEEKVIQEEEKNPLDDLSDQQLTDKVNNMEREYKHLKLENMIFVSFLKENEPSVLDGFEILVGFIQMKLPLDKIPIPPILVAAQELHGSFSHRRSIKFESMTSISSILEGRGPKINLSQKTDMAIRIMEDLQINLEKFLKKSHRAKRNLRAELEEFSIRQSDINEARDIFEYNIVTQGVDKLTQRIPAEKFVRYMEEWLKSAQLNIEKLRLRTASSKLQYKKVSATLVQRQELGENVHAVDFDQLEIENKHFLEKIEQKNTHLFELKKMNGGANLVLSEHKKYLQKQQQEYNYLKLMIAEKDKLVEETEEECYSIQIELERAQDRHEYFKKLQVTYKVPDVMEYVNIKAELDDIKKNIKKWQRRKKIQDIAINASLRQMKNITGSAKIDLSWLEDLTPESLGSDDDISISLMN